MGLASTLPMVGGIVGGLGNMFGGKKANTPDIGQLNAKTGLELGSMFLFNQQYQPQYAGLQMQTARQYMPQLMEGLRGYNPAQTELADRLTARAGQRLGLNGALDPATRRRLQQDIRGSQAARGLGYGPGDAGMESWYEAQTREARRRQDEQFATGMVQMNQGLYGDPFAMMLNYGAGNTMPNTTGVYGAGYGAQAGADTANRNKYNAGWSSLMSLGSQAGQAAADLPWSSWFGRGTRRGAGNDYGGEL